MAKRRTGIAAWYDKVVNFNVESLFTRRRAPGPPRTVYFNQNLPESYFDAKGKPKSEHVYCTNQVITSKYTIITFLPRNLLEQFRRIANIFFAFIAILQFFPEFSTISPGLVLIPIIIVLGITAIKDGYEDIKRHQSDRSVNHSQVRVLVADEWVNPNINGSKSRTFVRGIIPKRGSSKRQDVNKDIEADPNDAPSHNPAIEFDESDSMTEGDHHHIFGPDEKVSRPHWRKTLWEDVHVGDFVKIMDNEPIPADVLICATSEEENVAFVETKNLDGETNLKSRNASQALADLRSATECASKLNSFSVECDRPDTNMYRLNTTVTRGTEKTPADLQTVLLRGTVLRNTKWAIGVVLYTGVDTKIMMNAGGTPSKRSRVERQMNPQVLFNLGLLAIMGIVCAIADSKIEQYQYPEGAPWLYNDDVSYDNPKVNGIITWAFACITFQNVVPISLYISIEAVKTCQALWIYWDYDIFYKKTGQATIARSYNLSDDLGQIEYIFSDKTGTLTQNSMVFRQCSIGGSVYRGDEEEDDFSEKKISEGDAGAARTPSNDSSFASTSAVPAPNRSVEAVPDPLAAGAVKLSTGVLRHFRDEALANDLARAVDAEPDSENAAQARALNGFFSVLALCHTVLTAVDPKTGAIEYKAQSPDEAALVQAAADVGFIFRGREKETLLLQTPFSKEIERYELLNILEFTSARKRMSIVVRKLDETDNRLFLLTKGADNVIFERLKAGGDELKKTTEEHLDEFARDGLRTLTLAYKVIPEDEFEAWNDRYHEASTALENREEKIENICDQMEQDLRLLGATAIEDRLQDGVPETIADLKLAGIKIWVATGDKLETAIAIGHSTNLIADDSNIIIIRGGNEQGGRSVYQQMVTAVEDFFPDSGILDEHGIVAGVTSSSADESRPYPMRRLSTGAASIVGEDNGERPGGFVLVIDGTALGYALADDQHRSLLLRLAVQCEGVICCRVSPLQKALVVKLVKEGLKVMTLAIGDGANDVSMIQAADVGVGINGEEGLQAVNSSDYAIAQFRFLKRLILVHGHWSYARNGIMIVNFFYKNIVCIGVLWWFQIYCGWTSAYAFDYTYLLFWNSFWTIAPVLGIGLFDRIVDADVLMAFPELYRYGRERTWFSFKSFLIYMFDGVVQSVPLFFIITYAYFTTTPRTDGYDIPLYEFSTTMVFATVVTVSLFNGLNTNVWTGWVFFAVFVGIVLLWLFTLVYNAISPGWFVTDIYGNNYYLFRSAYFWLCQPITIAISLLPRYLYRSWQLGYAPGDLELLRYLRKTEPDADLANTLRERPQAERRTSLSARWRSSSRLGSHSRRFSAMSAASLASQYQSEDGLSLDPRRTPIDPRRASRTDMSTGVRSIHRGFDFATEENGVQMRRMQSNLSERRQSSRNLPSLTELTQSSPKRKASMRIFSSLRRKKPPTPKKEKDA
ncbi:phospholipid-translocating P-type ATPase [Leucogyrophana mollusca]|uniref:Phospholipid-translocating P-type ATPase n=1 Tax=Leucogyrophana mollusca TaxID=85980 RepID=A0ACB8B6F7_9AGAM|nr:phospholipid-translocating P-type ATPase [Leucogyrophana mollusca]